MLSGHPYRSRLCVGAAAALLLTSNAVHAEVRLPAIIGDGMVIQRGLDAKIWGWADPGEMINVQASWSDVARSAAANADGQWLVYLEPAEAGGPHTIDISDSAGSITLENVMSGEVWICSGQSNMQWAVTHADAPLTEIAAADYPDIRVFTVQRVPHIRPVDDCNGSWSACTPQTIPNFSAVAYFFGRHLHQELGVPIGLISTNWGGTRVEAWTSDETLAELRDMETELQQLNAMRGDPESLERNRQAAQQRWWANLDKVDQGAVENWRDADADDSLWYSMRLPALWETTQLGAHDGVVWFRRAIDLPQRWTEGEVTLALGPIDDMDTTYVNGQRVGGYETPGNHQRPREYVVPASLLRQGSNVITVRVVDTGGAGGFGGTAEQMFLRRSDADGEETISLAERWRYQVGAKMSDLGRFPNQSPFHQNSPTALFNGMIAPILNYGIRGAIWYQGESNVRNAWHYRERFPAMITDWRQHWGRDDFPFYYVQIAPFGYGGDQGQAAELREAQLLTLSLPNVGMAVTMDIGNPRNIHPTNKQDVGKRLAFCALAQTYNRSNVPFSGPMCRSHAIEDNAIRLRFDDTDEGLVCRGDALTHFTIAGADRKFVEAEAVIDGDSIIVTSDAVSDPVAVRFAWGAADEPNLFNGVGLPASSFRTDDWPGLTQPKQ